MQQSLAVTRFYKFMPDFSEMNFNNITDNYDTTNETLHIDNLDGVGRGYAQYLIDLPKNSDNGVLEIFGEGKRNQNGEGRIEINFILEDESLISGDFIYLNSEKFKPFKLITPIPENVKKAIFNIGMLNDVSGEIWVRNLGYKAYNVNGISGRFDLTQTTQKRTAYIEGVDGNWSIKSDFLNVGVKSVTANSTYDTLTVEYEDFKNSAGNRPIITPIVDDFQTGAKKICQPVSATNNSVTLVLHDITDGSKVDIDGFVDTIGINFNAIGSY